MNKYEKLLWEQLEEYRIKGEYMKTVGLIDNCMIQDLTIWENTRNTKYIYQHFPIREYKKKGICHILVPKRDFEHWIETGSPKTIDGIPMILSYDEIKCIYFACKEVVEDERL